MATQTQTYNPASGNTDDALENRRMLSNLNKQDITAVRMYGERDEMNVANEYISDWNLPSALTSNDLTGVGQEDNVTNNHTNVEHGEQISNWMQTVVKVAPIKLAARKGLVGDLGTIDKQEMELRLRVYRVFNAILVGNKASHKATSRTDANECGSPLTFLGGRANRGNDLSSEDSIISAASTTVLTNSGGYDTSTKETTAIDDDTTTGNRAALTVTHLLNAVARIYGNTRGHSGDIKGNMGKPEFCAFIPHDLYQNMVNSVASSSNFTSLNRFTTRIGGSNMEVQATVSVLITPYGKLAMFPIVEYFGDGSNNKIVLVSTTDASQIIYQSRPEKHELNRRASERETTVNAIFTCKPPKEELCVGIVGVTQ